MINDRSLGLVVAMLLWLGSGASALASPASGGPAVLPDLPGPVSILTTGPTGGLVLSDGTATANLWIGPRDVTPWDHGPWLNVQTGSLGVRLLVGNRELLVADRYGGIHLKGEVFLGRTRLDARAVQLLAEQAGTQRTFWRMFALVVAANFLLTVVVCRIMLRRWRLV